MLTTAAMTGFKNHVKRTVAYARYKIGSTWYRVDTLNMYINTSGQVSIDFTIDPPVSGTVTISEVQLYNTAGELWLDKADSIVRKSTQEGIFYRFTVDITEV